MALSSRAALIADLVGVLHDHGVDHSVAHLVDRQFFGVEGDDRQLLAACRSP